MGILIEVRNNFLDPDGLLDPTLFGPDPIIMTPRRPYRRLNTLYRTKDGR